MRSFRKSVFAAPVNQQDLEFFTPPYFNKKAVEIDEIKEQLKTNFLTQNLSEEDLETLTGAFQKRKYKENSNLISYGENGSEYFLLSKGRLEVLVYEKGTNPKDTNIKNKITKRKQIEGKVSFGEIALL